MNPFAEVSLSLALTLLIWAPPVLEDLREHNIVLTTASARFLLIFWVLRFALRWIGRLTTSYRNGPRPVVDARLHDVRAREIHVGGDGVDVMAPERPARRKSDHRADSGDGPAAPEALRAAAPH